VCKLKRVCCCRNCVLALDEILEGAGVGVCMARGWGIGVRAGDCGATMVFRGGPAGVLSLAAPSPPIPSIIQLYLQKNVLWEMVLTSVAVLNNGPCYSAAAMKSSQ
jgi:hypothetical protein